MEVLGCKFICNNSLVIGMICMVGILAKNMSASHGIQSSMGKGIDDQLCTILTAGIVSSNYFMEQLSLALPRHLGKGIVMVWKQAYAKR